MWGVLAWKREGPNSQWMPYVIAVPKISFHLFSLRSYRLIIYYAYSLLFLVCIFVKCEDFQENTWQCSINVCAHFCCGMSVDLKILALWWRGTQRSQPTGRASGHCFHFHLIAEHIRSSQVAQG